MMLLNSKNIKGLITYVIVWLPLIGSAPPYVLSQLIIIGIAQASIRDYSSQSSYYQ